MTISAYIRALAVHLPEKVLTNDEMDGRFPGWDTEKIYKKLGVRERHKAAKGETSGDLCVLAAEKLFTDNGINREDMDFVILSTQYPDYIIPSTSCIVHDKLGLRHDAGAVRIDFGCSGFLYGLALAKGLVTSGISKNVLLLTCDVQDALAFSKDDGDYLLFGDGATATMVSHEGFAEIGDFVFGTDGSGAESLIIRNGGARHPVRTGTERDDHGYMDGDAVLNFILREVPPLIKATLEKNGLTKEDCSLFILHQMNKLILDAIRKGCAIPKEKFHMDIEYTGNTSSSTVPIALRQCIDRRSPAHGDTALLAGFGVGLSWAGVTLKFL